MINVYQFLQKKHIKTQKKAGKEEKKEWTLKPNIIFARCYKIKSYESEKAFEMHLQC